MKSPATQLVNLQVVRPCEIITISWMRILDHNVDKNARYRVESLLLTAWATRIVLQEGLVAVNQ